MDIRRFKRIIEYSRKYKQSIESNVKDFYDRSSMNSEKELLNLMQIIRPMLNEKGYLIIQMPFSDKEIGALCYRGDALGYTVLNTSLPKVNVNFALCHELYHIFYQKVHCRRKVELINENYYEYEDEFAPNLFAGMLLMPETSYKFMFHKFITETAKEEDQLTVLVKLMSYFEVPYMAALIRCYELDLLASGETLEKLLSVHQEEIRCKFAELWLDDSILDATKRDDYAGLERLVKDCGDKFVQQEYLNERSLKKVLQNMRTLYGAIKGE